MSRVYGNFDSLETIHVVTCHIYSLANNLEMSPSYSSNFLRFYNFRGIFSPTKGDLPEYIPH